MAKEIYADQSSLSGLTLYAHALRAGQKWNGTAFESVLLANWASYKIAMTEAAGTGFFSADVPAGINTAGLLSFTVYKQAGGSAAATDAVVAVSSQTRYWDGSVFGTDSARAAVSLPASIAPGAANGLMINGTNAGAVTFGNGVTITNASGDALVLSSTGGGGNGLNVSGNLGGTGIISQGGATGRGMWLLGGSSSGTGFRCEAVGGNSSGFFVLGAGSGVGWQSMGGPTGPGVKMVGGSTSGIGLQVLTTSGDGVSITPTAGNAITATANGSSTHGLAITGGTGGTSDGIHATAGTGGVDIRGSITGSFHGTLDTVTNYTGNTPQTGDAFARLGAPSGASISADIQTRSTYAGGPVASVTAPVTVGTNNDKTGYALSSAGLDAVTIESGVNARQALSPILAASAGILAGAAGTAVTIAAAGSGNSGTNRITATVDSSGNRSAVTLNLPA